jgi:hypothetical protein
MKFTASNYPQVRASIEDEGSSCIERAATRSCCLYLAIMRCVIVYEDQSNFFGLSMSIEYFTNIRLRRSKMLGNYTILGLENNAVCNSRFTYLKSKLT